MRLPLTERPAEAGAPGAPAAATPAPRRVLVIEDRDDNRAMLKSALELIGHVVIDAADGTSGAERAIREAPDVVVVDIGLPGLDGYEVARRIRAARGGGVLLVALTGYGQEEDRRAALAAGFDVHLTKPVAIERVADVIARS